jgi:vacuolar-type H+-ATPase subunit H
MPHCQNFKQRIEELKGKAQNIEDLLSEYVKTVDKKTEEKIDSLLKEIEEFKEEFKTKATQLIEEFIQRRENKDDKVKIIFDERDCRFIIDGNLNFSSRTHLNDFPNLIKEITGHLYAPNAQTINLPNLEKIGGSFDAIKAQTINLPNLKEVGGYFSAHNVQTINLPNLKEVGGYFYAIKAKTINLPNLKEVGGSFWADNAQTINLPNIKEIRGNIYFKENNSNFDFLIGLAREWREKGILKGRIFKKTKEGMNVEIP